MLIFFICFLFLYSEMKMIPTKTIFNVTEDQEIVRVQWTKNTVTFCHCWYVCTSAYIVIFTPSRKPSVCDKKNHYIILHCLFLFLKVFMYCTFCLQNVWHCFYNMTVKCLLIYIWLLILNFVDIFIRNYCFYYD